MFRCPWCVDLLTLAEQGGGEDGVQVVGHRDLRACAIWRARCSRFVSETLFGHGGVSIEKRAEGRRCTTNSCRMAKPESSSITTPPTHAQ